jgi:hypothetical protein
MELNAKSNQIIVVQVTEYSLKFVQTYVLLPQFSTIQYNTMQYNTTQHNTIQYNTIQCNTIHWDL